MFISVSLSLVEMCCCCCCDDVIMQCTLKPSLVHNTPCVIACGGWCTIEQGFPV